MKIFKLRAASLPVFLFVTLAAAACFFQTAGSQNAHAQNIPVEEPLIRDESAPGILGAHASETKGATSLPGKSPLPEYPAANGRANPVSMASNDFGFRIFSRCFEMEPAKNAFVSPYSIFSALVMLYNGAEKNTRAEFDKAMLSGGMDVTALNSACMELRKSLTGADPKVIFEAANSVWAKKTLKLKEKFSKFNKYYHASEVLPIETAKAIDDWVRKHTRDKISLLLPDDVVKTMPMALINAIYFKGDWSEKFDKAKTQKADFRTGAGAAVKCDMMQIKESFKYYEDEDLQAVELPYGAKRFVMRIFLPSPKYPVKKLVDSLAAGKFGELSGKLRSREGTVKIPKFKIDYESELSEVLKKLGIADAFSSARADFSKIAERGPGDPVLFVSKVIHKTFVEVNEEGTEAAAVTAIVMSEGCAPGKFVPPFNFVADRPFVFTIADGVSETVLFAGVINDPTK